ncbi:MAG TPA: PAS domain S-box protein [Bryobacteraceae bacterium]|nr:PAS domain S-box protein [Bryobacteraceae bacterium]
MPESDSERVSSSEKAEHAELDLPSVFHRVLESVPEAVIEVDATGKIVFANGKVEEMFGYQPSELLNKGVEVLIPEELQTRHAQMRAAFSERPKDREMGSGVEFAGLRKDGTRFSADIALNPLRFQNYPASHILAFVRDVTHLRRIEIAERELLEKTLLGLVMMLNSLMSITFPWIFNRTQSIKALVSHMAKGLNSPDTWQYQLAAELCLIGCSAVPPTIYESVWAGEILPDEEMRVFRSHPAIGQKLLSSIPRLEQVAEIIGKQQMTAPTGIDFIEMGVCLLQLAQRADKFLYQGGSLSTILPQLRKKYEPDHAQFIDALSSYTPPQVSYQDKSLLVGELQPGMILGEDFKTATGLLIAPRETKISVVLLERIKNFGRMEGIQKRIQVRVAASPNALPE